ncbi:rhodanese-like domain-containing protein [Daejeonella lutea]|uniref:Rhodanese-related sulfurtransferase n=1 Tax=Daejeonella lutea TaxID=572036 RepID=A0A1T5AJG4_9SPHI|nr:rhodanese-like domain-containing protein [Daejeonella lutea]SKB34743.1 Rhodanese-related sulfurtransferase [Daejeonella lutea]
MDISAAEFNLRYKDDDTLKVIDVREPLEFQTFNVGGENIPLGSLIRDVEELDFYKDEEIVVICQRRSETAKRLLAQNGYTNVRNLTGGLLAIQKLNSKSFT